MSGSLGDPQSSISESEWSLHVSNEKIQSFSLNNFQKVEGLDLIRSALSCFKPCMFQYAMLIDCLLNIGFLASCLALFGFRF